MHAIHKEFLILNGQIFDISNHWNQWNVGECHDFHQMNECRSKFLPGGLSITVSKPVRRVRPPGGAGESSESTAVADDTSSVQLRPCIYLKISSLFIVIN